MSRYKLQRKSLALTLIIIEYFKYFYLNFIFGNVLGVNMSKFNVLF